MKSLLKKIIIFILQYEAKLALKKYKPRTVLIAGSVGKTTTKDAVFSVLSAKYFVRKSEKSFNSEIGLPLAILGLQNAWNNPFLWFTNIIEGLIVTLLKNTYPHWLVLEVGVDRPGDMERVVSWLPADMVILTRLPDVPVHVEFFPSPEAVAEEKAKIIETLKPGGTLILNGDDENVLQAAEQYPEVKTIEYGMGKKNDVIGMKYGIASKQKVPQGIRFAVRHTDQAGEDKTENFELHGVLGRQHLYPVLAGVSAGIAEGMELPLIKAGLANYVPPRGRMNILPGVKKTTIIDDSYNSSPVAVEEALRLLEQVQVGGRKIAVLGDMMELGKFSIEEHKRIGGLVKGAADMLVTVGFRARHIAEGALNMGMHGSKVFQYEDVDQAGEELEPMLQEGDLILAKASQSIRLEKLVADIMAEPERQEELLVRQDREWRER